MKILFATSEAHPLIKTGGLADVSGSLPNALSALKHKVRLVLPAYGDVMAKIPQKAMRKVAELEVGGCGRTYTASIFQLKAGAFEGIDVPAWLVDIPELFARGGNPYLAEDGTDWWDNGERYGVFSKVVTELSMDRVGLKWKPDVVHVNDWQTGLVSALLSLEEARPKTVFTVHNMAFPGNFPHSLFAQLNIPAELWGMEGVEFWGHFSMLKAGLVSSDWVTTVSPTYAKEICFPEFAYGFEGVLQKRREEGRLVGILNGIDETIWNPKVDELIHRNYSLEKGRVAGKKQNKTFLLNEMALLSGLDEKSVANEIAAWLDAPLVGFVGRMVGQKGLDLVLEVLPEVLDQTDVNFVFVGNGNKYFEAALLEIAKNYPQRVWVYVGYSEVLAHQVEAGADLFLMPSRFEPCGLNQMYSLAYGTPPIVHHTGGLADTVVNATDENLKKGTATGFVFYDPSRYALKSTLLHALHLYGKKRSWQQLQKNGMQQNFGWKASAKHYVELYSEDV
ncbi:glycogen synthase GlgA [Thiomicrorhabdus sp.]|uniref:glycogen synthase GlgA n=1 Tax=Thiomicrorhabdus sp. TaxID=2039724 RepID=UPI00356AE9DD